MTTGWIKLHRSMLEWRWFSKDVNVSHLFIYILLKANRDKDALRWVRNGEVQTMEIPAGSLITNIAEIADNTGLTPMKVRRALELLVKTEEIVIKTTNKYTIITVCKYDYYQVASDDEQQTNNKQTTNKQQTTKESPDKKEKKVHKENKEITEENGQERKNIIVDVDVNTHARDNINNSIGNSIPVSELKQNASWKEAICMKHHVTPDAIDRYIDEFELSNRCRGSERHDTRRELMSHFDSWLLTRLKSGAARQEAMTDKERGQHEAYMDVREMYRKFEERHNKYNEQSNG